MFREALARAGVFAFVFACLVPFVDPSLPTDVRPISVADAFATAAVELPGRAPDRVRDVARAELVRGVQATPIAAVEPGPAATPEPTPEPTPTRTPAPVVATLPPLPHPPTTGIVVASWYGPGFYGNRTACGQVYTPEIVGVAHRTLPCARFFRGYLDRPPK